MLLLDLAVSRRMKSLLFLRRNEVSSNVTGCRVDYQYIVVPYEDSEARVRPLRRP